MQQHDHTGGGTIDSCTKGSTRHAGGHIFNDIHERRWKYTGLSVELPFEPIATHML